MLPPDPDSLDPQTPEDWDAFRAQSHRMLDDMLDYAQQIRTRPVWQSAPATARASFAEPLPRAPGELADAHATFMRDVLPYAVGNVHPGFMGWVHGGGTPVGMLAELLAAGVNFVMGVPGADDIMLGYQSTSFHDALAMRDLFGRRPAPEFEAWLKRQGLIDSADRIRPRELPSRFRALLTS